ncbi:MAG: nucleotide pyrophosphohydrolase [Anaerolineae bacterium]|jgi:NTP pyrophosphatase (non-canonical NTP hydrolase)
MSDAQITVARLRREVADFVAARDWESFHTPKNLSLAIAVEAAELIEHFLWLGGKEPVEEGKRTAVADELADVLIYVLALANVLDVDLSKAVLSKLERNEERFPVEEWRGRIGG